MKILSLDGGGSRGIISLIFLKRLEEIFNVPLNQVFDIFCGCSTGSIIASLLSQGYKVDEIYRLYKEILPIIFNKKNKTILGRIGLRPLYKIQPFIEESKKIFKDIYLRDLEKNLLILAYDTLVDKPLILKSWEDKDNLNIKLWQAVCMSCCCPTLFPGFKYEIDGVERGIVDGVLVTSNPSLIGISETLSLGYSLEEIKIISIGTGDEVISLNPKKILNKGSIYWGITLPKLLIGSSNEFQSNLSKKLIKDSFRLQIPVKCLNESIEIDNSIDLYNEEDLIKITYDTERYIKTKEISEIYEHIKKSFI
ncbi:patatin-like phospholipase family protein [Arthrospira platensis SPKY2]